MNFHYLEETNAHVRNIYSRLISKVDDWTELLDTDEQGDPVYLDRGMPESHYNPDIEDLSRKTSIKEETLTTTQDIVINLFQYKTINKKLFISTFFVFVL